MIPDLSVTRIRVAGSRPAQRAGGTTRGAAVPARPRWASALALVAAAAALAGCNSVPLTAPSNAAIKLYSNTPIVPINGTAEITATIIQGGGVSVHNGTQISFTTSLGRVEPSEAETRDGKVTVTFYAGNQSGTAIINAYSGGASTTSTGTPTTGGTTGGATTTTSGGGVTILVGAAAVGSVVVTASPSTVSAAGGSATVTATVLDANNNALPGVPVSFSADVGDVSPNTATTNTSGQATTRLTTYQTATVTVTAGPKITGTTKVTAIAMPTLTITPPSTTPTVGVSSTFSINIAVGTGGAPIVRTSIDFDDGSTINLGAATGTITIPHTFRTAGTFEVTASATDASGQTATMTIPVDVFPAIPFPVTLTAPSGRSGVPVTLTATPGAGAPAITSYVWSFGDGTTVTTTANTVPHTYVLPPGTTVPQQFIVTVTANGADGRTGTGSAAVTITQ